MNISDVVLAGILNVISVAIGFYSSKLTGKNRTESVFIQNADTFFAEIRQLKVENEDIATERDTLKDNVANLQKTIDKQNDLILKQNTQIESLTKELEVLKAGFELLTNTLNLKEKN